MLQFTAKNKQLSNWTSKCATNYQKSWAEKINMIQIKYQYLNNCTAQTKTNGQAPILSEPRLSDRRGVLKSVKHEMKTKPNQQAADDRGEAERGRVDELTEITWTQLAWVKTIRIKFLCLLCGSKTCRVCPVAASIHSMRHVCDWLRGQAWTGTRNMNQPPPHVASFQQVYSKPNTERYYWNRRKHGWA